VAASKACILHVYSSRFVTNLKLVAFLHRLFTTALVLFYFTVIEQIAVGEILLQNLSVLIFYILYAHGSSLFNLDFVAVYWQKLSSENKLEYVLRIGTVVLKYSNLAVFVVCSASVPLFSWLDYEFLRVDTDFYALRYLCFFFYMVINNVPYSAIDSM